MQSYSGIKEKTTAVIPFIEGETVQHLNGLDRTADIALSAYYKAEARGYEPGHELQDWLEAEAEVSQLPL